LEQPLSLLLLSQVYGFPLQMRKPTAEPILLEPLDVVMELITEPIHSVLLETTEVTRGAPILSGQQEVAMVLLIELIHLGLLETIKATRGAPILLEQREEAMGVHAEPIHSEH
jgi:hypothetical protein